MCSATIDVIQAVGVPGCVQLKSLYHSKKLWWPSSLYTLLLRAQTRTCTCGRTWRRSEKRARGLRGLRGPLPDTDADSGISHTGSALVQ